MRTLCALLLAAAVCRAQKAPTSADQDRILAEIREYAVHYVEGLPDYVCLQRTQRNHDAIPFLWAKNDPAVAGKDPPHRLSTDVIEEELTVSKTHAEYRVLKINGLPAANIDHDQLGSTISGDTFGSILGDIFDPTSGTKFSWDRLHKLQGRSTVIFAFNVPQSKGFEVRDRYIGRDVTLAYKGLVYADTESKAVLRLEVHAAGFPDDSFYQGIDFALDYAGTRLDGRRFVLPGRFELHWRTNGRTDGTRDVKRKPVLLPEESTTYGEFKSCRMP